MSYAARVAAQREVSQDHALDDMRFLVNEKIGQKQSLTPEGFLLIQDTPIARCGWQVYTPDEIPLDYYPDFKSPEDGVYRVKRDEDEVFAPEAMASGNGKPIVDEHPEKLVTPETHEGAPGVVLNVRRGVGGDEDLLVADLLVYNKALIQLIRDGKRELSCGYDVDYEELSPGKLAQRNIRINHVALVDSGRCGPRCSIGDHASPDNNEENSAMAGKTTRKVGILDTIKGVLRGSSKISAKDVEELEKALGEKIPADAEMMTGESDDEPAAGHSIAIHNHMPAAAVERDDDDPATGGDAELSARVDRLESAVHEIAEMIKSMGAGGTEAATSDETEGTTAENAEVEETTTQAASAGKAILGQLELEAPPGAEAVDVRRARDSRFLADSFQATAAMAEIITPGIKIPEFDQKLAPARSFETICGLRRTALDLAYQQADTRGVIDEILGGRALDVKKMSCDSVRSLFKAVGTVKKSSNSRSLRVGDHETRATGEPVGRVSNLTSYQKMLDEHYKGQKVA